MGGLPFYIVDVFAEQKYAGNQLAVVNGGSALSTELMQDIANEMHFSETAFILSRRQRKGGFDVRIFTPASEVPFAGHPTLGTAYIIRHFMIKKRIDNVLLNLKVGQIPVSFEKTGARQETIWMEQVPPAFGKIFSVPQFASVLGLSVGDFVGRFPIQEVSTGMPFIIVPLKTLDAVKRARVRVDSLLGLVKEAKVGILVFCPETYEKGNDLNVRVFVDLFGIPEDPATGSGNGCLAGYLSRYRYFGTDEVNAKVEQGYEVRRRSLLLLKAEDRAGCIRVHVGGRVVLVAAGKLA